MGKQKGYYKKQPGKKATPVPLQLRRVIPEVEKRAQEKAQEQIEKDKEKKKNEQKR